MFEQGGLGAEKKKEEADLDITPMIDVVFLLLIFFMVTSTMQGTPDKDIPPAKSGTNAVVDGFIDLTLMAPQASGVDGDILLDDKTVTLEQLKTELVLTAGSSTKDIVEIMIYAERDVLSGFVGEVEAIIGEVATETGKELQMKFAVRDK